MLESDFVPLKVSQTAASTSHFPGETFNVLLVAVDQVNNCSVDANFISSLASPDGASSEGQQTQPAGRNCTDLTFNVLVHVILTL